MSARLTLALVFVLAGTAAAGGLTFEADFPHGQGAMRPGSYVNPYRLKDGGREHGTFEEALPGGPGRELQPGTYANPYRWRERRGLELQDELDAEDDE